MTKSGNGAPRKPATKFPQLQKQMAKNTQERFQVKMQQVPKQQGRPRP